MSSVAEQQAANPTPPRRGKVLALTVDSTTSAYPINTLDFGGYVQGERAGGSNFVFITLQASGGDIWFQFAPATATDLDHAAVIADGGTLAYANTYGWRLPQNEERTYRINRDMDRFLIVKTTTSTATLLIAASSEGF